ncbi:adenylyl cyclase [Candidatus Kaiserbacteria bacterium]|nr:MAG: adenylyl cyclase [Candidatus Kaiserbacteria bacterium]
MQEFEGVFLKVDVADLETKLASLGAKKIGDYHYKRKVFDYPDLSLDKEAAWVRLRDEGDVITLAFKKRLGVTGEAGDDSGMMEHEIEVSDFAATAEILKAIGLTEKFYLENKRSRWKLDDVTFDFDSWPLLDTYLEIESSSDEKVDIAAEKLGLSLDDKLICSTTQIYEMEGIRDKDYKTMTFNECVKREN